ncbi:hypothetical protein [Streptomyces mutomycini]|uniref:Uncharacterized protein n=1 Tax=Streptomyces mutomycini TaxID=284036 RepID=A0ABW0B926_9ACTN|nr:hypothetical protein [Streptomyces mutomycini]
MAGAPEIAPFDDAARRRVRGAAGGGRRRQTLRELTYDGYAP